MVTRNKLELPLNQPLTLELLYDEPVVGENRFGNYYLYAVKLGDEEYSFFAPEEIHESMQNCKRGDKVILTKLAAKRGNNVVTKYVIDYPSDNTKQPGSVSHDPPVKTDKHELQENADKYFETMLKSYQDAISINESLNGFVDVSKVAITLFIARSRIPINGSSLINNNGSH